MKNNSIIVQQTEVVEKESNEILSSIDGLVAQNNINLCFFVVDTVRALMPNFKVDSKTSP